MKILRSNVANKFLLLIFLWQAFSCMMCSATPGQRIKINEFTAVVERALWRGEMTFDQSKFTMGGEFEIEKIKTVPGWIILMKDVKGMDEEQIKSITGAFGIREPAVTFSRLIERNPKLLYIWINGDASLKITHGQKITISEFEFESDERGGAAICKKITVKD